MTALPLLAWALASPFTFHETSASTLELVENGKPVFAYNYGMMLAPGAQEDRRRCCYLHPVYAPNGVAVTDDFPRDHYHHRGIFWAWPEVTVDNNTYNLWDIRGIHDRFIRWTAKRTTAESAVLGVENGWFIDARQVVRENVEMIAHAVDHGRRVLDVKLTFEALERPVGICGTHDHDKGYGGFSFRFSPRAQTVVRTDAGVEAKDTDMVPHQWAQLEGEYSAGKAAARVDILGDPQGWCLRHYGFLGVNYPGLMPFTLQPGKPLVLQYRVTLR